MISKEEEKRREIIGDFKKYCQFMLPNFKFKWYHYIIMDHINDSINGRISRRLMFFMAPRHGKTLIGADMFLTYMFGRYPNKIGGYGTYGEKFAELRRDAFEKIVTSDRYIWLFPKTKIKSSIDINELESRKRKSSKNTAYRISNVLSERGEVVFVGRGNPLTGWGLDYASCDDLYKDDTEAQSVKINETIFKWFMKVWMTRSEPKSIYFTFYTRWVSDDVAGRLLAYDEKQKDNHLYQKWEVLRFAAEKDELNDNPFDKRQLKEPLDEDRVPEYEQAKIDPISFQAMYQQRPINENGTLFKLYWFPRYSLPHKLTYKVISIDSQFKASGKNVDRTAITVWGIYNNKIHMHPKFINDKMDFDELLQATLNTLKEHPDYWAILVEDSAMGQPLMNALNKHFRGVIGVKPNGKSKRERAQLVVRIVKNFEVVLPDHSYCQRISEFEHELTKFTGIDKEEKDDLTDTMVQALNFYDEMRPYSVSQGIVTVQNSNPMISSTSSNLVNQVLVLK